MPVAAIDEYRQVFAQKDEVRLAHKTCRLYLPTPQTRPDQERSKPELSAPVSFRSDGRHQARTRIGVKFVHHGIVSRFDSFLLESSDKSLDIGGRIGALTMS